MLKTKNGKLKKGFTLVELIVVIGVLLVLSVIAVAAYSNVRNNARISAIRASLSNLAQVMSNYENASGVSLGTGAAQHANSLLIIPADTRTGQLAMTFTVNMPAEHASQQSIVTKTNGIWQVTGRVS